MLRATQSSEIPAGDLGRVRAEDSDRTRMLKDVMKSVAKYAAGGLGKGSNESAQAAGQLIMKAQSLQEEEEEIRKAVSHKEWDPCERGWLSSEQERRIKSTLAADDDITEKDAGTALFELLTRSRSAVLKDCKVLSLRGPLPEKPPRIDTSPIDVCLVSRREAEDIMSGGATDKERRDQAAGSWVQEM